MAAPTSGTLDRQLPLTGLALSISPEFTAVDLAPPVAARGLDQFVPLGHRKEPLQGVTVTVSSTDDKGHKVVLTVEGSDSGWQGAWTRWSYLQRKAHEFEGGDALDAQDEVSADGLSLTAMILAGESRAFNLQLSPTLTSETSAGRFGYEVVARDANLRHSPELRRPGFITLRHPRSTLLQHLPSIFLEEMEKLREEEAGGSPFFERLLLGFQDAMLPLQRTLDRLDDLFGPYSTPSEFLLWLASWLCAPVDENWSEMQRRRLIREAVTLYRWRGTKRGLSRYLQIYTGVVPEINDQPVRGMRLSSETKMGDAKTMLGDVPPHTFVVTLASPDPSALNEQVIHDIIRYEKPAHTAYALRIVRKTA